MFEYFQITKSGHPKLKKVIRSVVYWIAKEDAILKISSFSQSYKMKSFNIKTSVFYIVY